VYLYIQKICNLFTVLNQMIPQQLYRDFSAFFSRMLFVVNCSQPNSEPFHYINLKFSYRTWLIGQTQRIIFSAQCNFQTRKKNKKNYFIIAQRRPFFLGSWTASGKKVTLEPWKRKWQPHFLFQPSDCKQMFCWLAVTVFVLIQQLE
jgi:hypothetical protein